MPFKICNAVTFLQVLLSLQSFYTVYRQVFETISKEDLEFTDDPNEDIFPNFGKSDSSFDEVQTSPLSYFN